MPSMIPALIAWIIRYFDKIHYNRMSSTILVVFTGYRGNPKPIDPAGISVMDIEPKLPEKTVQRTPTITLGDVWYDIRVF
jgi:hypothetical protein